ncbi:uncharacterized protein LOC135366659 [Ornithodoros turicata]|uniref:uncharacterized protein LOC135366659 n=1 Tax=Ornithodoros turicata TaxID=34597 RepID=UPI0031395918
MEDEAQTASSAGSSRSCASGSAQGSDESDDGESSSRCNGVREEDPEHDSECEVTLEHHPVPSPIHNYPKSSANGRSSGDAIRMETSCASTPSAERGAQNDATETPTLETGGASESRAADSEQASAVHGFCAVPRDAVVRRTSVAESERRLERSGAEVVPEPGKDEFAQDEIVPAFNGLEENLKLELEQMGGGGEQIISGKTVCIDGMKSGTVGNVAGSLHMYPVYEMYPARPGAELDYADSFAVAENKIAMKNKKWNATATETAGSDEYSVYDVQRISRSPRGARLSVKKHRSPSSKQRQTDKTSPQFLNMANDDIDSLREEAQLANESDLETECSPLGYDSPQPRIRVIRTSVEDLDNFETICSLLESLSGDVKGDFDRSKIQPIVLEASYFEEGEDDAEKWSPERKKRSKKAKSTSSEIVQISRKKKRDSSKKTSSSTSRIDIDDEGSQEVTLTEVSEGDGRKNKKVRFFRNLVYRRKKIPSGVAVGAAKDRKQVSIVKKAGWRKGKEKPVARRSKGDESSDLLETEGTMTSKDEAREASDGSRLSRASKDSRASRDSWGTRTSVGSTGSADSNGTRKASHAEGASRATGKADARKHERKEEVMDVNEEENSTSSEKGQEMEGTRKVCEKKQGGIKSSKAKKKGDGEEEGIRIKRNGGGGIRLILPRTASLNIDSTGSCERSERRLCDKCSEEVVAKKRTRPSERSKEVGENQRRDSPPRRGDVPSYTHRQFSFERRATAIPRDAGRSRKEADMIEMFELLHGQQRRAPNDRRGTAVNRSRSSSYDQRKGEIDPRGSSYGKRDADEILPQGTRYDQRESFGFRTRDTSYDRRYARGTRPQDVHHRRNRGTTRTSCEQEEPESGHVTRSPASRRGLGHLKEVEIEVYNKRRPSRDRKMDVKGENQTRHGRRDILSTVHPAPASPPPSFTQPPAHAYRRDLVDFTMRTPLSPLLSGVPPPPVPPPPPFAPPPPDWDSSKGDLRQQPRSPSKRKRQKGVDVSRTIQISPPRDGHRSPEVFYRLRTKASSEEYKRPGEIISRTATTSNDSRTDKDGDYRQFKSSKARWYAAEWKSEEGDEFRPEWLSGDYQNVNESDIRPRSPPGGYVEDGSMVIRTEGTEEYEKDIEADVEEQEWGRRRRGQRDRSKDFRSRKPQHQQECISVRDSNFMSSQRQPQRGRYEADNGGRYTPDDRKKERQQGDDGGRRGPSRNWKEGTPELSVETRYERRREGFGDYYVEGHSSSSDDGGRMRQPGRTTTNTENSSRSRSQSPSLWSTQRGPLKRHPSSEYAPADTSVLDGSLFRASLISFSDGSRKRDLPRDSRRRTRTKVPVDEWGGREGTREETDKYRRTKRETGGTGWRSIISTSQEWEAGNREDVRDKRSPCRSSSIISSKSDIEGTSYTGCTSRTGYTAQAGYTTATSHVESATNISGATSPRSGSQSRISSNVDVRQRRKIPEVSSEINVTPHNAARQKYSELGLTRRADTVDSNAVRKHPPSLRVGPDAIKVQAGHIAHHRGSSRSPPTSKQKPSSVERSPEPSVERINLQIFPEEGLTPKIILEHQDGDEKQTLIVKTSRTEVKGGGSSEDVTHKVKKGNDKSKSLKNEERAQQKGSGSSCASQYDDAKSKVGQESIFKASVASPRINVWHVPPADMKKYLASRRPAFSDTNQSRSGSRHSESRRSGSRRLETSHYKRIKELRQRRALEARLMAEASTTGYETIDTGGAHDLIQPHVEISHGKASHSLSNELISRREEASSALPGQSKQDPHASSRTRCSSKTEIKCFANTEEQFGLPTVGTDPFRQPNVRSGAQIPLGMMPSMGPYIPHPGTEGLQGMPVQQTIIVPGSGGRPPILTQTLGQGQVSPITLDGMESGQTFLLQSQGGGHTILTQVHSTRTPNTQENASLQTQQPGLASSHSATRITSTHRGGLPSMLPQQTASPQPLHLSPSLTRTVLIQPGPPTAGPERSNHFQQDPREQERITMIKSNTRYTFPSPPMYPAHMGPRFTGQSILIGGGAQPVRPAHHHHHHPFGPPHWHQPAFAYRRSHSPQGRRSGFMAEERTRRSPRNAFSQPAIQRTVGTLFTSDSFMTACEATQAPLNAASDGEAVVTLASTSAPAVDLRKSVSASCSYSQSSGSGKNAYSFTISTESPSRSDGVDIWDRSKQRSVDPILPEVARNSRTPPKGLRRFTNKGQSAVYFLLCIVAIAGIAGAISLYRKRRWTHEEEEEIFEGGDSAKMFGPWQRFDDARNPSPNSTGSCVSLHCSLEALALTQSVNRSVNPCDDFYGHACSSQWKAKGSYASFDGLVKNEIQRAVVNFFKENTSGNGDIATSRQFWQGCINVDEIVHLGNAPFLIILNMTGLRGWPHAAYDYQPDVAEVWRKAGKILRLMSLSPLLDVRVIPSLRRNKGEIILSRGKHIPAVQRDSRKYVGRDALAGDVAKAFKVVHPTGSYFDQVSSEVSDFILKLSNLSDGEAERRDGLTTVVKPFITNAFGDEDISPPNGSLHTTQASKFVDDLVRLVQATPSRIILNYLGFSVVRHAFLFSPSSAKEVLSLGKKTSAAVTRESECVRALLDDALPKEIAERVVYAAVQKNVDLPALRVLASDLKKSAVNRISKLHWMDPGTRAQVARQLREINVRFFFENDTGSDSLTQGPPSGRLPDVVPGQTLLSYQHLRSHRFKSSVVTSISAGASDLSGSFAHEDCTYYSDQKVLLLPLSTLNVRDYPTPFSLLFQVPRFGIKLLRCLVRALHCGNIDNRPRTRLSVRVSSALSARRNYERIRSCINKQYLKIRDPVENKLANREDLLTALNVVDNAVVGPGKDVYEAYASTLRHSGSVRGSEALEGLTWAQLFYVSYAQGMCEVLDHDYNFRRAKQHHESPNWERVNVPLGNDEQFLKVFKCGGSSAMNQEPRCRIWD